MDIREMVTGYGVIEAALLKKKPSRTPCFPLIDTAFAAAYSGKSLREVQTDPELHAAALENVRENYRSMGCTSTCHSANINRFGCRKIPSA
jgi:hypothetical protein